MCPVSDETRTVMESDDPMSASVEAPVVRRSVNSFGGDGDAKTIKIIIRSFSVDDRRIFSWNHKSIGSKRKSVVPSEEVAVCSKPSKKVRLTVASSLEPSPAVPRCADPHYWVPELGLCAKDRVILSEGEWLTDNHIVAAQLLLRRQFPALEGLQEPVLGNVLQFKPIVSDGIQIMQNGSNHWVTLLKAGQAVKVMDSKNMALTVQLTYQVINLCSGDASAAGGAESPAGGAESPAADSLEVRLPTMHRQRGSSDCGVFALAYATELAFKGDPELVVYEQKLLREHLARCFETGEMTPFPKKDCKTRTARAIGSRSQLLQKAILPCPPNASASSPTFERST